MKIEQTYKLLYINKQYRTYDYLKYITLSQNFSLSVIWLCPFLDSEPLPPEIQDNISFNVLNLKKSALRPWYLLMNFKIGFLIWKNSPNTQLIISSTSNAWHSKIAYLMSRILRKSIAFRKEIWYDVGAKSLLHRIQRGFYEQLTLYIETRAAGVFYPGVNQKQFLITRNVQSSKLFPFPYLINDCSSKTLDSDIVRGLKKIKNNQFIFLYMGRIIKLKGLDILLKAFAKIENQYPNVALFVVGGASAKKNFSPEDSKEYLNDCMQIAEQKCQNVVFFGKVNSETVQNYYHISDVFIQPNIKYLNGRLIGEGWGNVIVEAASMSLPIIATDRVASAFELVKNEYNGFIVNSDNIEDNLFNAMKCFVLHRKKMEEYRTNSRKMYEQYNNKQKIINSIHSIIQNGK